MSTRKPDPNQFEFDWLCLHLVREPELPELELTRRMADWPAPENPEDVNRLRNLTVRLTWLDLNYENNGVSLNDELRRAPVLLSDWRRHKKFWRRLAVRDPLRFGKILLVAQKTFQL